MSLPESFRRTLSQVYAAATSARGREVLTFMVFLLIAYLFWLMLTLNNEMQEDIDVPVELVNVPDSVTIISDIPSAVKVSVRDKGSVLIRQQMNQGKVMKLDWNNYVAGPTKMLVNRADLGARLREHFPTSTQIVTTLPDSIRLNYTSGPGRKVKVKVPLDIHPVFGSVIGRVTVNTDSVMVYSVNPIPSSVTEVTTVPVVRTGLSDSTVIRADIEPMAGARFVPDHIELKVAVEPLIRRSQNVPVVVRDLPADRRMHTFPSTVELNYLIPMSEYSHPHFDVKAYVDYEEAVAATEGKVAVQLSLLPDSYHNPEVRPDSVEFIIERNHN